MRFRKTGKSIAAEDNADSWGVALGHFINSQGENNGKLLLSGEFGKQRMFCTACSSSLRKD
jgi:hypothetical protein